MRNKKALTVILLLAAASLIVTLAFRVDAGASADSVAVLKTEGVTCGNCIGRVSGTLEGMAGVAGTEIDPVQGRVFILYDTRTTTPEKLAEKISETGYRSTVSEVMSPEQFKRVTGKNAGEIIFSTAGCGGCGGGASRCGMKNKTDREI